jgi:hypothetical protein
MVNTTRYKRERLLRVDQMSQEQKDEFKLEIRDFMASLHNIVRINHQRRAREVEPLLMGCRDEINKSIQRYPESMTHVLRNFYIAVLQNEIKSRLRVYPRNAMHDLTEEVFNRIFGPFGFTLTIDYAPPNFDDPEFPGPDTAYDLVERRDLYFNGPSSRREEADPPQPPPGMSTSSAYYTIVNNLHRRLCALERRK